MRRTLAIAFATFVLLCGQARAVYSGPQRVVQGCANAWVSNGTWAIRVTRVARAADRFDVSLDWRNDGRVTESPITMAHDAPFTALDLAFPGGTYVGLNDTAARHPEREKPPPALTRTYAPGETYRSVLHFYWNGPAPRNAPVAFVAGPLFTWRMAEIRVRLGCLSP
jgi:hypothetical protein